MALIIPPHGTKPAALVFTPEETLTALATLNATPTYANKEIRERLTEYYERVKDEN